MMLVSPKLDMLEVEQMDELHNNSATESDF